MAYRILAMFVVAAVAAVADHSIWFLFVAALLGGLGLGWTIRSAMSARRSRTG